MKTEYDDVRFEQDNIGKSWDCWLVDAETCIGYVVLNQLTGDWEFEFNLFNGDNVSLTQQDFLDIAHFLGQLKGGKEGA